jgi:uncharacterized protein YdhG (YjbR/CyaY superfamily)
MSAVQAPKTIDEYIKAFPEEVQEVLQKIRATIKKAAPDAQEGISYKMPAYYLNGRYLVYFAAHRRHIGMYPIPSGDPEFNREIAPYQSGKGTLQFPLNQPIPYRLISKVVKYRAAEEVAKATPPKKNRKSS